MRTYTRGLLMLFCGLLLFAPAKCGFAAQTTRPSLVVADSEMADGEVRKVDKENGKITIRHGELKNLNMPPMTMVFKVRDPALLDRVRPGDKVRFRAVEEGGTLVITDMDPVF